MNKNVRLQVCITSRARQEKLPCLVWMHQMLHQFLLDPVAASFLSPQARHAERSKQINIIINSEG